MAGTRRAIMIKTTVGIATLALACSLAVGANAQLVTTKHLTLPIAATIATTAMETCKAQGYNVSVHIIGDMGEVLVALRGDNTGPHTMENSMRKAYTARTFRVPSGEIVKRLKENPQFAGVFLTNVIATEGALPITVGDDVIGAVGVSGAPGGDKDAACAKTGIDKVADQLK
jgi:uncharacterized protein GlcG (DUF336 family)